MSSVSDRPSGIGLARSGPSLVLEMTPGRPWRGLGHRIVLFDQRQGPRRSKPGQGFLCGE